MPQSTDPPIAQPLLIEGTDQTSMAWVAWFQSATKRLDACEARLLVGEARLLSIETRLAAAGIP